MAVSSTKNGKLSKSDDQTVDSKSSEQPEEQRGRATEEQLIYASILGNGRKVGLAGIAVALIVYLTGVLSPKIPISKVPQIWQLPSGEFMKAAGIKPGWAWVGMYHYGDMINFFGVAILGIVSVICYIAILPKLMRKKDTAYIMIAIAEVLVLLFAASGIVHIGE